MGWSSLLAEVVKALRKFAAPILAFWAGRKVQKNKERAKDDKAEIEDLKRQVEVARDIDRASRDGAERERVRRDYTRPDPDRP